ncbi:MAG: hypothetical protein JXQ73_17970 [Phycisphaerae bacterium]|nr:hypothetical protein [Phycisphaerae bacterium]
MVVVVIILLLLGIIGAAWRSITETNVQAKAVNTVSSFAAVARTYAMRYQLETVLTINPRSGQLDMYVWDTVGHGTDPTDPNYIPPNSRYVYAPVLDDSAKIPNRADPNRPDNLRVRLAPIDYWEEKFDGGGSLLVPRLYNNLAQYTLCFDAHGRLVVRDLTLEYEPIVGTEDGDRDVPIPPTPGPLFRGFVKALWPGHVATAGVLPVRFVSNPLNLNDETKWFFQITSARGGIAYAPPQGGAPDAFYDPNTIPLDPNDPDRTDFMLNQYTGRVVKLDQQEVPG